MNVSYLLARDGWSLKEASPPVGTEVVRLSSATDTSLF